MGGAVATTHERVREADRVVAELGRGAGRLRLRIGEGLDVLDEGDKLGTVGFAAVRTYAFERCERGPRWAAESRALARRLLRKGETGLPKVRHALMTGMMSWSMAELVARHASAEDEAEFIEASGTRTVAKMVTWIAERARAANAAIEQEAGRGAKPKLLPVPERAEIEEESSAALQLRVTAQEMLMLHAARTLVTALDGKRPSDEHFWSVLLAEAISTMTDPATKRLACAGVSPVNEERLKTMLRQTVEAQRRREDEAEAELSKATPIEPLEPFGPMPPEPLEVDAELRRCSKELVVRDLRLGQLVRDLFAARGWKLLKYGSQEQYARERIGMSLSALRQRIRLADWVDEMPELGQAIETGELGFEAAMLVGRIANPDTVVAWIDRAKERTLKHLREEVEAVKLRSAVGLESSVEPPTDEELEKVQDFERQVLKGEAFEATIGPKRDQQISVIDGAGCELSFRVSAFVIAELHRQRAVFDRVRPPDTPMTFVEFLCASLCMAWLPTVMRGNDVAYASVYQRDRWQCSNPMCDEPGREPHHVELRSRGGSDGDENVIATGHACHRPGIHGGRLGVTGPADDLTWTIGTDPVAVVRGRVKKNLKN